MSQIKNQKINFVSPEDLILSKLLWYKKNESERELRDIESILKFTQVDMGYIKRKALEHSTINILQQSKGRKKGTGTFFII